eukprot:scaffold17350_cov103-Isochrysis_galbana.AAC.2
MAARSASCRVTSASWRCALRCARMAMSSEPSLGSSSAGDRCAERWTSSTNRRALATDSGNGWAPPGAYGPAAPSPPAPLVVAPLAAAATPASTSATGVPLATLAARAYA